MADTKSKTSTATETATKTSTEAYTQGNVTVTGGAGKGNTIVHIGQPAQKAAPKTGTSKVGTGKENMTSKMNRLIGGK